MITDSNNTMKALPAGGCLSRYVVEADSLTDLQCSREAGHQGDHQFIRGEIVIVRWYNDGLNTTSRIRIEHGVYYVEKDTRKGGRWHTFSPDGKRNGSFNTRREAERWAAHCNRLNGLPK